jgi:hypothetical protein
VVREWNETAYTEVTKNVPLLPAEVVYVGLVILLVVPALLLYVEVKRGDLKKRINS